jgi:hypothetical protein
VYRRSAKKKAQGQGDLVSLRRYADAALAEVDRAHLESAGITAHVFDSMSFNPIVAANIGAISLQVAEGDVEDALEVLGVEPLEEAEGDDEPEGSVRCPRCELAYCAKERPRLRNADAGTAFLALPFLMIFGEPRWHCHKCGHVWDDPNEGPRKITKLEAGDPRPVFRLRRTHAGMGLFLGLVAGLLVFLLLKGTLGTLAMVGVGLVGLVVGRLFHHDVCSAPECRAPLERDAVTCLRCKGSVAGLIESAPEHFAAAAGFRRELAVMRANDRAKARVKKQKKLKKSKAERTPDPTPETSD